MPFLVSPTSERSTIILFPATEAGRGEHGASGSPRSTKSHGSRPAPRGLAVRPPRLPPAYLVPTPARPAAASAAEGRERSAPHGVLQQNGDSEHENGVRDCEAGGGA